MPERDGYIPGVPCWVDASEPDPDAATEFYRGLFGWEFEDVMPPGSGGKYFIARLRRLRPFSLFGDGAPRVVEGRGGDVAGVRSVPEAAPQTAMWNTYIWVDSADETAAKVRDAGGGVVTEPFEVLDAARMAVFTDPEGAAFCAYEAKMLRGARIVNDPGSLNFNSLNTRNVAGAKSFYRSVFGWQTITLEGGAEMWVLPGYGDYLARDNPDLRKQMAEADAPTGFEDVVATINPIPDDQPDPPAHWSVTFAVDDADGTAAKATELGGKVIVPPFDAPWVRMTIIKDPQGATFIASKFVPQNKDLGQSGATVEAG